MSEAIDFTGCRAVRGKAYNVPYLSELQKKFYKHYIKARYDLILVPALDLAASFGQEESNPVMGM